MRNNIATAYDWRDRNTFPAQGKPNLAGNDGGAIYILPGGSVKVQVPISFINNYASYFGGAVQNVGTLVFTETAYFMGNTAHIGGALCADYSSVTTFKKTATFEFNKTVKQREINELGARYLASYGGAIAAFGPNIVTFKDNTEFHKNSAHSVSMAFNGAENIASNNKVS
ncbi:hypothetical protein JKP88DRAFT_273673 [Tribonema minus]|uniref:Uncharacterized protein n=1 Tax=Tribonema minus TaxID=303371 RepID=A0A835YQQ9_9STRA|nr:hypothetical protein JKP88DRAFT_273673 [Tribonema minus]